MSEHEEQGGGVVEDVPAPAPVEEATPEVPVVKEPKVEEAPVEEEKSAEEPETEHHPVKDAVDKAKAFVNSHNFGWASKGTEHVN